MRDEWFIRGEIPMTKSEVRAVSVSRLELQTNSIVYDIGAGTGSVSVEAALKVPEGHVYAFEQKEEGCALIRANAEKAGLTNLTVVPGKSTGVTGWLSGAGSGVPWRKQRQYGGNPGSGDGIKPGSSARDQCDRPGEPESGHGMVSEKGMGAGGGLHAGIPGGKARPVPHDAGAESDLYPCGAGATDTAITERSGSARTERTRAERCRFPPYPAGSSGKRQRQDSSYHRPSDPGFRTAASAAVLSNAARTTSTRCFTNTFWVSTAATWTASFFRKRSCRRCFENGRQTRSFPFWKA